MKIGIITLYNADYGSYFQAVSLYRQLEALGHDVELVHILNRENRVVGNLGANIVASICPFLAKKIAKKIDPYNTYLILRSFLKKYKISKIRFLLSKVTRQYDCVFYGADELWSACNPYVKYIRTYYGYHVACPHISYATSGISLGTPSEQILSQIKKDLSTFSTIGVRDAVTKEWVSKLTKKNCVQVIDPTLLYPFWSGEHSIGNYVLIYGEVFESNHIQAIKEFAANNHFEIKSISWKHDWCERVQISSEKEFQELFAKAAWVMSSTFHGTIFAITNHKNFTAFDSKHRGAKLQALLNEVNLSDRLFDTNGINPNPIDYDSVDQILQKKREFSCNFLKESLAKIEEKSK